jgi:hypothetical protein
VAITREEIIEKKKRSRLPRGPEGGFGPAGAQPNPIVMAPAVQRGPYTPQDQNAIAGPNEQGGFVNRVARAAAPGLIGGLAAASRMTAPRPMGQPLTSPRPEMPEQATAAQPPQGNDQQAELRNRILMKQRERELSSRRQRIGMTTAYGPDGQINADRADTLRDLRYQRDDLAGSMAPAPKVQSAGEVQAARTSMRGQGLNTVEQTRKQALIAQRSGNEEEAQRLMNEAMRMEIAFRRDFGDHTPEAAQEIVGRQQAGAQRAEAQRGAYREIAAAQGNDPESITREQIAQTQYRNRITQLAQSRDISMLGGDVRENEMRGRTPPGEVPPDVSATQGELQNTELRNRLAEAKEQARIADMRRTAGGQVTADDMQLGQNPGSVLPQYDGSFKALKSAFGGGFTGFNQDTLYAGSKLSGNSQADLQKLPVHVTQVRKLTDRIIALSKVDPAGASRAAMYMLARMPERGRDGQYDASRSFLGFSSNQTAAQDIVDQLNFIVADLGTLIQGSESAG